METGKYSLREREQGKLTLAFDGYAKAPFKPAEQPPDDAEEHVRWEKNLESEKKFHKEAAKVYRAPDKFADLMTSFMDKDFYLKEVTKLLEVRSSKLLCLPPLNIMRMPWMCYISPPLTAPRSCLRCASLMLPAPCSSLSCTISHRA